MLSDAGVDAGWFRANAAQACAGIWIYLRYVLDEIRDGIRNPRSVGGTCPATWVVSTPSRSRGGEAAAGDEMAQRSVGNRPRCRCFGVLGAARAPLTVAELARFAGGASLESVRVFIEETVRAFLNRRNDAPRAPRYGLRHQSLRDLLTGNIPGRPDLDSTARMLAAQVQTAHRRITEHADPAR